MGVEILSNYKGKLVSFLSDGNSGALVIADFDLFENHEGNLFGGYHENTSAPGATFAFSFKTPPASEGIIHYRSAGINPTKDLVRTQVWEGATINTPGTLLQVDCLNRVANTPAPVGLEVRAGTTFSNNGVLLSSFSSFLPGAQGTGQSRTPQSAGASLDELILKPDTVYRFVNINGSDQTNVIASKFRFYISKEI